MESTERRGFTLIELLVVIAIIAILAAILFPVFAKAREQARRAACWSNLKELDLALHMYAEDYNGWFPMGPPGATEWNSNGNPKLLFRMALWNYCNTRSMYYCSNSDALASGNNHPVPANAAMTNWANALRNTDANWNAGNICYNYYSFRTGAAPFSWRLLNEDGYIVNASGNVGPCETDQLWLMSDPFMNGCTYFPHLYQHARGLNVAFVDGHVKVVIGRPRDMYY